MNNKIYLDTSTLIKRYIEEPGSTKLDNYTKENYIYFISGITRIEFYSAFKRRLNDKTINAGEYKICINRFEDDFPFFQIVGFDNTIELSAIELINNYQMKTLDSIQLASALLIRPIYFLTSDEKLFRIAEKEIGKKAVYIS